jgi:hypothetical protein
MEEEMKNNIEETKKEVKEPKMVSKLEKLGKDLLNQILVEDPNAGGQMVEITSGCGMGKTSVLLFFVLWFLKHYPQDKIIWNNSNFTPSQFMRLPSDCYDIFVEKDKGLYFKDVEHNVVANVPHTEFSSVDELWNLMKPGRVSVIVLKDRRDLMDVIHNIRKRHGWTHIFIDEAADVYPSDSKGKMNKKIKKFAEVTKELRKCRKSIYYCTQSVSDLDYRVRGKKSITLYGPNSRVEHKGTRVYQQAVDKLTKNPKGLSCFISIGGNFGLVQFTKWFAPAPEIQSFFDDDTFFDDVNGGK